MSYRGSLTLLIAYNVLQHERVITTFNAQKRFLKRTETSRHRDDFIFPIYIYIYIYIHILLISYNPGVTFI